VPTGPASSGGLNNAGNDPSGAGNAGKLGGTPALNNGPGTNSAGTAQSSGITTGMGGGSTTPPSAPAVTGPDGQGDIPANSDPAAADRKVKSICKGC
jgi:hypothetical protein